MPDERAIVLEHVGRVFQSADTQVAALNDVTVHVDHGEVVAITGPSGSGKTTLLNVIAGLERPTEGQVTVLGRDLTDASERDLTAFRAHSVGLVFQDSHLLPGLTALENVVVAKLPWSSWRVLKPEATKLLEAVGLGRRLDFPPSRLSGGERQRVGIARALLGQPQLLLADEPTGNLDSASTEALIALLERLRHDYDLTVVIATHDPVVASMAARVVRLVGGMVEEDRQAQREPQLEVRDLE